MGFFGDSACQPQPFAQYGCESLGPAWILNARFCAPETSAHLKMRPPEKWPLQIEVPSVVIDVGVCVVSHEPRVMQIERIRGDLAPLDFRHSPDNALLL